MCLSFKSYLDPLSVLAIWREGRAYHSNLRDMALGFGDALLHYGPRDKMNSPCSPAKPDGIFDKLQGITSACDTRDEVDFK
jgi:hypothetical protein